MSSLKQLLLSMILTLGLGFTAVYAGNNNVKITYLNTFSTPLACYINDDTSQSYDVEAGATLKLTVAEGSVIKCYDKDALQAPKSSDQPSGSLSGEMPEIDSLKASDVFKSLNPVCTFDAKKYGDTSKCQ